MVVDMPKVGKKKFKYTKAGKKAAKKYGTKIVSNTKIVKQVKQIKNVSTKTVKGKKVPHPKAGQYVNNEEKQRDQLFGSKQGSAMDFRLFINKTLAGTGLELGLTTKENNKIKRGLGITPLTPQ